MNTHGEIINFGKHSGTLITRVPASYLKWMVNAKSLQHQLAKAEIERRGHKLPSLEISAHAIDKASLRCRKIWHETALSEEEGICSWLERVTLEALEKGVKRGDDVFYMGMKFVIYPGEEFPVLKTIMPKKEPKND